MCAIIDDGSGPFERVFTAQVSDSLFRNYDLDTVLTVVEVGDHRDDCADGRSFSDRWAGEDRDIGVPGEVTGASDAIH